MCPSPVKANGTRDLSRDWSRFTVGTVECEHWRSGCRWAGVSMRRRRCRRYGVASQCLGPISSQRVETQAPSDPGRCASQLPPRRGRDTLGADLGNLHRAGSCNTQKFPRRACVSDTAGLALGSRQHLKVVFLPPAMPFSQGPHSLELMNILLKY